MTDPSVRRALTCLVAAGGAATLAACAPVDEPAAGATAEAAPAISKERSCFFVSSINGYSEAPDGPRGTERLLVHTGVRERHVLETFGACPDLDWSLRIGIDTRAQSSLCTGDIATVLIPRSIGGDGIDRCTARVIGKLVES